MTGKRQLMLKQMALLKILYRKSLRKEGNAAGTLCLGSKWFELVDLNLTDAVSARMLNFAR